ncbi:MAG: Spore germination protein YndE [Clostridium sp.]
MNKIEISAKQMEAIVAVFLSSSVLVMRGSSKAEQDSWLCVIAATVAVIPLLWVHTKILELYPGQNYFGNVIRATGKPVGTVLCLLLIFYSLSIGTFVLRIFAEFMHIVNMTETPLIAILVCMTAVMVYTLSNRLYVLARISKFVLPFVLITVIITVLLSYKTMDINNLKPILHTETSKLFDGFLLVFALPYGEIIICMPMFGAMNRKAKIFPTLLKAVLISFLIIFIATERNRLVLGYSDSIYAYPSYETASVISLGGFLTRVEVLIGINLLLSGFIKTGVLLFTVCDGIAKTFHYRDYEPFVAPMGLVFMTGAVLSSSNTVEMFDWLNYLPVYSLPFQIIIPVLVLIVGTLRKKFHKPQKKGKVPVKHENRSASPNPQQN